MFDINKLLRSEAPGDMAIGVVRNSFYRSPEWQRVLKHYPTARLLFKYRAGGKEVPESLTVTELQAAVQEGTIAISIDDGSGGLLEEA